MISARGCNYNGSLGQQKKPWLYFNRNCQEVIIDVRLTQLRSAHLVLGVNYKAENQ